MAFCRPPQPFYAQRFSSKATYGLRLALSSDPLVVLRSDREELWALAFFFHLSSRLGPNEACQANYGLLCPVVSRHWLSDSQCFRFDWQASYVAIVCSPLKMFFGHNYE